MKLVCIADTHTREKRLHIPFGNVLIHAGDFSETGTLRETKAFLTWFTSHNHHHKILVPGNHDFFLHKENLEKLTTYLKDVHLLINTSVIIEGYHFWGSPNTSLGKPWAFGLEPSEIEQHWKQIPRQANVIITHNPPYDILDHTKNHRVGCPYLKKEVQEIQPKYHIFGHAHDNYGNIKLGKTTYINATSFDDKFTTPNEPVVLEL
ncbi:metallophosphatase domain-containing protein [Mesonia ostreae]|uniref:Metallophosphatase domain-containing protein n=1 Tax=Mesonia ostreae TaxID=861110 RepID=A0ABU2KFD8_9FLAO|nr:metallophosphatase domain-containing protein [Mesonia ostreae]MDT0293427.1 metallophosphatase domain-containing protein [Mesonia ostreae]